MLLGVDLEGLLTREFRTNSKLCLEFPRRIVFCVTVIGSLIGPVTVTDFDDTSLRNDEIPQVSG